MKFLIDMNLGPLWVPFLANQGFEAVHWSTVGQPGAPDSEILDFAAANGWIVFTHDLDFGMLLAALGTNTPSVIQVRSQDVLPSAIGDVVLRAIRTAEPHLKAGALVTVDSFRHRIRLLPSALARNDPTLLANTDPAPLVNRYGLPAGNKLFLPAGKR